MIFSSLRSCFCYRRIELNDSRCRRYSVTTAIEVVVRIQGLPSQQLVLDSRPTGFRDKASMMILSDPGMHFTSRSNSCSNNVQRVRRHFVTNNEIRTPKLGDQSTQ